jgi:sodium-dependent dicarboxylate transporter 2/3/5
MSARALSLIGGLLLALVAFAASYHSGATEPQCWTAAVATLCGMWWVLEALPLSATALVPLVVFPAAGVLTERQVAAAYGDPIILLFMGGFMLSKGAEHWGAHHRIAHFALSCIGATSGRRVVLAIMLATAFISMWISNTAVALMMLPVALAVLKRDTSGKLAVPLLLGLAYSSSIGGIGTLIGTAPNGVFKAAYEKATNQSITFDQWMLLGVPIGLVMLLVAWFVLTCRMGYVPELEVRTDEHWTTPQKRVLIVFGLAALAWIFREIPFGGWSQFVNFSTKREGDMAVAIAAALSLFFIPSGDRQQRGQLLDWETAADIPWGVLILFGGGIAISTAFETSGLSGIIGDTMQGLSNWPTVGVIGLVTVVSGLLSEFTSNTATANILMPILAGAAKANGMEPALLMIPATISVSLVFIMPVGTPPNAIVYATGHLRIGHMVRAGLVLKVVSAFIVTLFCWQLLPLIVSHTG